MKKEKKKGNKKVKLIVIAAIALVLVVLALNYDRALAVIRVGDAGTAKVAATGKKTQHP